MTGFAWSTALALALVLALAGLVLAAGGWWAFRRVARSLERSLGSPPKNTIWEWLFSLSSTNPREIALIEQRAEQGTAATHPMGSPKHRRLLDDLAFDPATFDPYALPASRTEIGVALGPRAALPLRLRLPVLPAPMGWGVALTEATKVALAQATALAGTAANSGEGPFLSDERADAARWILQSSRGGWGHQPETVRLADMVEIQIGQASEGNGAVNHEAAFLPPRPRRALDGRHFLVIHAGRVRPLTEWIAEIRQIRLDIPVGVKIPAGASVERDVLNLVQLGVDVITLDGSEAGTAQSPAVIHDFTGIPITVAVRRADRALRRAGLRHRVSLVASGGLRGAADIAKILALGADAAALGTALLFAASHQQLSPLLPGTPPTALVFVNGAAKLDVEQAVGHLLNWFRATRQELEKITGVLGLPALALTGPEDLIAHEAETGRLLGVPTLAGGVETVALLLDELSLAYAHWTGIARDIAAGWQRP